MSRPGLIRSLLFGQGQKALLQHLQLRNLPERIHATGAEKATEIGGGQLRQALHRLKTMAIGDNAPEIVRQRFIQGGVLGRGGVLHGSFAFDPGLVDTLKTKGVWNAVKEHPIQTPFDILSQGSNTALMAAVPGYAAYKAFERGDAGGVGRAVGEGLGWGVAAPFRSAGLAIAVPMSLLGRNISQRALLPRIQSANMNATPDIDPALFQNYT